MAILKVKTNYGWVEGIPGGNQAVSLFRGIPYAAPPVGELRWKEPQPLKPWDGVLKAYKFTNICWQERVGSEGGGDLIGTEFYCLDHPMSEDCLTLNVWTPAKKGDEKLPVGVYFHGGGYSTGYGFLNCYDGEGFAKRDCVFVTVTHRLNLFGFLAHPWLTAENEHHSSGNYGALDLIAALKWVKENIEYFGGDPDCVTIFGQSGGGGKVQTMIASPLAKGLFRRAIMQSGGALPNKTNARYLSKSEEFGVKFFEYMGFKNLEEARAADPEALLKGLKEFTSGSREAMRVLGPQVDGYLLEKDPNETFLKGEHPALDYMVGCTAEEFVNNNAKLPDVETERENAKKLYGEENVDKYIAATHLEDDPEKAMDVYKYGMGLGMLASAKAWVENEVNLGRKPSYQYYLTLVPPGAENAHHSAEHHYVFQTLIRSKRPYKGRDWDLSNALADYWANFIKTGDPNDGVNPTWTPYTADNRKAMEITYDLHMAEVPESDYVRFLKEFALGTL